PVLRRGGRRPGVTSALSGAGPRAGRRPVDAVPDPVLGRPDHLLREPRPSPTADAACSVRDRGRRGDAWLHHMRQALDSLELPEELATELWNYLSMAANSMRN